MNREQQIKFAEMAQYALDSVGLLFGKIIAEQSAMSGLISSGNMNRETNRRFYVVLATNDEATRLKDWFDQTAANQLEAMKKQGVELGKDVHVSLEPKDWPA